MVRKGAWGGGMYEFQARGRIVSDGLTEKEGKYVSIAEKAKIPVMAHPLQSRVPAAAGWGGVGGDLGVLGWHLPRGTSLKAA